MHESKFLNICLKDNQFLKIDLYNNPLADYFYNSIKHLKNVPLNFFENDIFFNSEIANLSIAKNKLENYANNIGIQIDVLELSNQSYLNYLHEIYEKSFDGTAAWLRFHEYIHIIEKIVCNKKTEPIISFNYRTLAGKLEKPFLRQYNKYSVSKIQKNQCFMRWQELAKPPYFYYENKEIDDIDRLCELAKPWITLRPSFHIACYDIDVLDGIDLDPFDKWFAAFKDDWCKHWDITDWDSAETFKVIPIGQIEDADVLVNNIKNNNFPIKITR